MSNLTDQMVEGQFVDQQLRGLLVTTDLTESDGTGASWPLVGLAFGGLGFCNHLLLPRMTRNANISSHKESYASYIYKVLKQVHPDTGVSS